MDDNDKKYEELVHSRHKPDFDDIVALARALCITEVPPFWELFDKIHRKWAEYWTNDSSFDPP